MKRVITPPRTSDMSGHFVDVILIFNFFFFIPSIDFYSLNMH